VPRMDPKTLVGHTPQSPALGCLSSLLGKAASVKGQILPRGDAETEKYFSCGRNIGQQGTNLWKRPEELRTYYVPVIHDDSSNELAIWQALRPTSLGSEVNPGALDLSA
jgi:hypothetical protein